MPTDHDAVTEVDADEAFIEKYFQAIMKLVSEELARQGKASGDEFEKFLTKAKEFFEQTTVEHAGAKVHVFTLKETDETKEAPACVREWAYSVGEDAIRGFQPTNARLVAARAKDSSDPRPSPPEDV